jgi:hypothetical protein
MEENTLTILVVMISHAMTKQGKYNVIARCAGELSEPDDEAINICPWDDVHVMERVPLSAMAYALGIIEIEDRANTYVMEGDILTGVAFMITVDEKDSHLFKYIPKEYKS